MPILTYTPNGADPKVFDFRFRKLVLGECDEIEKRSGLVGIDAVEEAFMKKGSAVVLATLFVLLKRSNPTLKFDSLQITHEELHTDLDDDQAVDVLGLYDDGTLTITSDKEREEVDNLRARVAKRAEVTAPIEGEEAPKD